MGNLKQSFIAGLFSIITIGILTLLTYKTEFGIFLIASFGSSMVLLYGYPDSPFAQPKNVFFGHLVTATVGMFFFIFNSFAIIYNYTISSWFWSGSNDIVKCNSSTCRWKSNYSYYGQCLTRLFVKPNNFRINNYSGFCYYN